MELEKILLSSLYESLNIIVIIFLLMVLVEFLVLKYKNKIIKLLKKNKFSEYIISSFFGIIPGCIGTFAMDSLYMAGLLSFGGIVAAMISTSGDEAFLLISMAIRHSISWMTLISLMLLLFILGIFGGFFADIFKRKANMKFCKKCSIEYHKDKEFKFIHFIKEHVYKHILKKHIWQIFLWVFFAIFAINLMNERINIDFTGSSMLYILIMASLIALLPLSGLNVFLVIMFSKGLIPFSVLLANSIIQDGHGLLPIMGFSIEDSIKIKIYNFIIGFTIGLILLLIGF